MYLYQLLNGPNICCVLILYVTLSHLVCGCCCGICRLTTIFLSNMFPNTFSLTCCILICFLDQIPQLKGTLTKTFENLQSCIYVITFLHSHKNLSNIQSNIKVYSFITGKLKRNLFHYCIYHSYQIHEQIGFEIKNEKLSDKHFKSSHNSLKFHRPIKRICIV